MTEDLDKQIRNAIADLIKAEHADAQVYGWNALTHDLGEWPGLFGSPRHGWIIKRASQEAERKNASRDRVTLVYDIWGFYEYQTGTTAANSDDEFAVILAKTYNALKAEPRLGFENDIERHLLLQYQRITTLNCGEETLHFAQGRLRVELCC